MANAPVQTVAPCPRCDGKKELFFSMGAFKSCIVRCHVCKGAGTVPFAPKPLPPAKKTKSVDVQGKLF
jgi:hypothetical protein